MEDCIFCKITKKEIPCDKVYEDKDVMAFLDINPYVIGHVLVIPKKHSRWLWDMKDEEYLVLVERTKFLANKLKEAFSTEWIEVVIAGMDIKHTHIHLLPRKLDDGIEEVPKSPLKPKPSEEEMKKWAEKIRKSMK